MTMRGGAGFFNWRGLREALLEPRVDDERVAAAVREALEREPLPVVWLIGKTQAGKTSIIRALTGSGLGRDREWVPALHGDGAAL